MNTVTPFQHDKAFDSKKILPMSIDDFCDQEEINKYDFHARGVHVEGISPACLTEEFIKKIPENTAYVVEYYVRFYSADLYDYANAYGIALIPKNSE